MSGTDFNKSRKSGPIGFAPDSAEMQRRLQTADLLRNDEGAPGQRGPDLRMRSRAGNASSAVLTWLSAAFDGARTWLLNFLRGASDALRFGEAPVSYSDSDNEPLFGLDYWPSRLQPSLWRLGLGALLSPLAILGPTLAVAMLVYWTSESDPLTAWRMTVDASVDFFSSLYPTLLIGAALGGATLWALRLRSRSAYALVGGALGLLAGGGVYVASGSLPFIVAVYALISGAVSLLALRWIASVRKLD